MRQRTEVAARTGCDDHGGSRTADRVGAHEAHGAEVERAVDGPLQLFRRRRAGTRSEFFHRQRFAGEDRLADEKILGAEQADIRRHHVAGGQVHDIASHQLGDRHFDALAVAVGGTTRHRGGIAHHRLELLGGFRRAVFLSEAQQHADQHHHRNDGRAGEVGMVGGQLHAGQHQQHHDEGVLERVQQLQRPVRRLFVRHLVDAVAVEPLGDLLFVETGHAGVERRQQRVTLAVGFLCHHDAHGG